MRSWANRRLAAGTACGLVLAAFAIPALGQDAPESLLPPGFGDPVPAPAPAPAPGQPPAGPGSPAPVPATGAAPLPLPGSDPLAPGEEEALDEDATEEEEAAEVDPFDLPPEARRSPAFVGVLTADNGGFGADAWSGANGSYLTLLMRGTRAPVASRWTQILLRRALLTQTQAPAGVAGADWTAERAWLLLRMGEADAARMLVAGVDVVDFTPKMFEVAQQVALATADPAALCPLAEPVAAYSQASSWTLARAMCAAMAGETGTASAIVDGARRGGKVRGIDLLLAEKVVGAAGGRRAINIEWDNVTQLTAWRFGLANAVNVRIPAGLFGTVGPHVRAWQARAPMLDVEARLDSAAWAATLGVFSSAAYVDLVSAAFDATDTADAGDTLAGHLRSAYLGDSGERLDALRRLWSEPDNAELRYARLVLTARAAARIAPAADLAGPMRDIIASLLTAGLDDAAARWSAVVEERGEADDAWALLAVGAPDGRVTVDSGKASAYVDAHDGDDKARGRLLLAALAGLGRLPVADVNAIASDKGIPLGRRDSWTQAIDEAAARNQPGTVALLAATGMQTRSWRAVHPAYLYHIVAALRRVGREPEARMIAAEALTRT
jgi:hypothetical protein